MSADCISNFPINCIRSLEFLELLGLCSLELLVQWELLTFLDCILEQLELLELLELYIIGNFAVVQY